MLKTRALNDWLGTTYTLDEVAEMDWLWFDIMGTIKEAANPPRKDEEKPKMPAVPRILRARR